MCYNRSLETAAMAVLATERVTLPGCPLAFCTPVLKCDMMSMAIEGLTYTQAGTAEVPVLRCPFGCGILIASYYLGGCAKGEPVAIHTSRTGRRLAAMMASKPSPRNEFFMKQ
jgi:hypothetical protein